jgi:type I restriction enzyme, S subunit
MDGHYLAITSSFRPAISDLVLTIVGTLGRRALFNGDKVAFQRSVAFLRPDISQIDPRFLFHIAGSINFYRQLIKRSNATAQAGLYLGELAKITVDIPSKVEQIPIAYILDTIDENIIKTEAVIKKLKQVRAGLLHDLLSYGLDENGQLRDPVAHPDQFKDSVLGRVPKEWGIKTIDQLAISIIDGDRGSNYPSEDHLLNQGFCVFLNAKNIKNGKFDFAFVQFISKERDALLRKGKLGIGDIVITTRGTVGNIAYFGNIDRFEDIRINSGMIILRDYEEIFEANFFIEIWQYLFPSEYRRLSSGSAQPQFPIRDIQKFRLIIPSKPEQNRIVRYMSNIDLAISQQEIELDKLINLKSGLMDDLLTGRVLVPETIMAENSPAA